MSKATLLHNPKAGEKSYTKKELIALIENEGIKLTYSSLKEKDWDDFDKDTSFLILAGGDGSVRKVTKKLLKNNINRKYPLALLPAGTANNIAKTLSIPEREEDVIKSWKEGVIKKFDVGRVSNVKSAHFFLESFGFGIFPVLMQKMEALDNEVLDTPDKKLTMALTIFKMLLDSFKPFQCDVVVDGVSHVGKFLLVEIMNTQSIGPNLTLSPHADPGDGEFEVIFIPEGQKEKLQNYIENKLNGIDDPDNFDTCKAKSVIVKCDHYLAHIDDEIIEVDNVPEVVIELDEGALQFLI